MDQEPEDDRSTLPPDLADELDGDESEFVRLPEKRRIVIEKADAGERLDRLLQKKIPEHSRMRLKHLIEQGQVLVDGQKTKVSYAVRPGEAVEITIPPSEPVELIPEDIPLNVLFEDEHLIVVAKPAGMVVHPSAGHATGTLVQALLFHCQFLSGIGGLQRPGIVHRLDRGTSGVIIVAKTDQAHNGLQEIFAERKIEKEYLAITVGVPRDRSGVIQSEIGRHPIHRQKMASVSRGGRVAITRYRVLADYEHFAKVRLDLETGRTHQIRVHLKDLDTPVLGDNVYGSKIRKMALTDSVLVQRLSRIDRQMLHARRVAFRHPITKADLELEAGVPPDMQGILDRLEEILAAKNG